jgi:signal transduction histidine kinase
MHKLAPRNETIAMDEPEVTIRADGLFVSSNTPPSRTEKWLAFTFVAGLVAAFAAINYFADRRPHPIPGFALAFSTTMFVCDTVAAILLFAQFVVVRSLGLLLAGNAYALTAFVLIPYTMTFPGIIGPEPVLGSIQSAAFLYTTWHTGFCVYIFAYGLLKDINDPGKLFSRYGAPAAIFVSLALTASIVSLIAWFVTTYSYLLPQTLTSDGLGYMPAMLHIVGTSDVVSGVCALVVLWLRRRSALDLWLIVVVFLFVIDIPFTFYPVPVRYSIGWYFIRFTAFFSASILVAVLLHEVAALYARLSIAIDAQRREREARLLTGGTVAAMIAHEVKQPVSAIITRSETGHRWLDRSEPEVYKARDSFKEITANGHRTVAVIENIRNNFKTDTGRRTSIDANDIVVETLNLVRDDLRRHQIEVQAEPNQRRPRLVGDRVQLQQVLLNLITNAIDAMKAGDSHRILRIASEVDGNGDVAILVADTGTGIKQENMERIFHPLFTTKTDGMGMGLSICRSIIEGHGGQLSARPNTPRGAIFEIKLLADRSTLANAS